MIARLLLAWLLAALLGTAQARGLGEIGLAELPREARDTLVLIDRGGPFPYRRDGVTFGNREERLPRKPLGYYREYTVPTLGRHERGPRRIIAGAETERYYSSDHYRSFRRIVP